MHWDMAIFELCNIYIFFILYILHFNVLLNSVAPMIKFFNKAAITCKMTNQTEKKWKTCLFHKNSSNLLDWQKVETWKNTKKRKSKLPNFHSYYLACKRVFELAPWIQLKWDSLLNHNKVFCLQCTKITVSIACLPLN